MPKTRKKGCQPDDPASTPTDKITGHRHTIAVDWDGTCVPAQWPDRPREWMPGAVRALSDMAAYANVVIWTARINTWDPVTHEDLHPDDVAEEVTYIRRMLDAEGLTYIKIFDKPGKPTADVYIDDKAERYNGHKHSWDKLRRKVRMRFQEPNAAFPPWGPEEEDE